MDMFPVWLSLRVALTATALTLVIGIPVALLLARRRFPGKNVLEAAVVLPLVLPPTVLGYYLLLVIGSRGPVGRALAALGDRKSTRLNSSHRTISYAVFCLKKKKNKPDKIDAHLPV